jgi:hypothetical protein
MAAVSGIDWASEWHDADIADEDGTRLLAARFAHDERGICALIAALLDHGVCRVAIERPDGLLVGRLLAAGITVLAIHPNQVAAARDRFRAAAGKSDQFDGFVLREPCRTDSHRFPVSGRCLVTCVPLRDSSTRGGRPSRRPVRSMTHAESRPLVLDTANAARVDEGMKQPAGSLLLFASRHLGRPAWRSRRRARIAPGSPAFGAASARSVWLVASTKRRRPSAARVASGTPKASELSALAASRPLPAAGAAAAVRGFGSRRSEASPDKRLPAPGDVRSAALGSAWRGQASAGARTP